LPARVRSTTAARARATFALIRETGAVAQSAILSPHLDDAVLSCWHALAGPGDVVVINVFSAVPVPGTAVPTWDRMTGADDSAARVRARLAEDAAALALAGRQAEHLGFLDGQYRDRPPDGLLAALRERVPADAAVLAPASIGGHRDHVLVRDAALALAAEGRTVSFYAELPYATEFGWPDRLTGAERDPFRNVDAYWRRFVPEGYEPRRVELTTEQQQAKVQAMRAYRTQFAMLEGQGQRRLTHPELVRFELLWVKPS
jgi:LmbE family N-acetylglucosaminyl deacetylase